MNSSILRDVSKCSPLEFDGRFGGTYPIHLQGRKISQARNQCEAGSKLVSRLAYCSTLKMEGRLPPKHHVQRTALRFIPDGTNFLGTRRTESFGM
jgi:hypothetical protein